ncbi:hypothetical protein [Nocardioides pyridinolyticus]
MRDMRTQARRIGIAAASALVLVLPLGPMQPAQAAPSADLSITKQVVKYESGKLNVPADFDPARSATRALGHYEVAGSGLRLWTEAAPVPPVSPDPRKVAEYVATDTPLSAVGSPSLEWTQTSGAAPGYQLVADLDGNGAKDAILVGEYGIWWAAEMTDPALRAAAPQTSTLGNTPWQGSLADWQSAFPTAKVLAFGFSLGSGATGDGVLEAINFGGTRYTFVAGSWSSSVTAAPGSVLKYRLTVTNDSDADRAATNTTVADILPADLTYVPGSLKDNGNNCAFVGRTLSCNAEDLPIGFSTTITYRATLSNTVTSDGLPKNIGHQVDVQKQEVFADLPAGETKTYSAWCPSGYRATDGGLLVDVVDQGGFYSDLVTLRSKTATSGGLEGWTVTVANLGASRGQGKVKVTCLGTRTSSVNGHTHDLVVSTAAGAVPASPGVEVQRTCPAGYTPIAPWFDVTGGVATVQASYAQLNTWVWIFDFDPGTVVDFGASCLAPEATSSNGHTAPLALTDSDQTIPVAAEARAEGVQQCGQLSRAVTGGYRTEDPSLLSLGREQRGTNYMFRFYNDDWDLARDAVIQVQCVGVRTADERTYYTVTNTARVATTEVDRSTTDDTSSAVVTVDGPPVTPPGGVAIAGIGTRTPASGNIKFVVLGLTCTEACSFTAKVLKNDVVVAKVVKSLAASSTQASVKVPTTGAGRSLGAGQVTVKVKTASGTNTRTVTLS